MKNISIRALATVGGFFIGTGAFTFWFLRNEPPVIAPPKVAIDDRSTLDPRERVSNEAKKAWDKEILGRFKEEPFENSSMSVDECYRLVLLPTFDPPLLVRLWRSEGQRYMVTKKLDGLGGYGKDELGKLSLEKSRPLSQTEWNRLIALLDGAEFWYEPTKDRNDIPVPDGAVWVMDGTKDNMIHTLVRITPNPELQATL